MKRITAERLRELLDYSPESGEFRWRQSAGGWIVAGNEAGTLDISSGYLRMIVDGHRDYAHRLAWLYVHGEHPPAEIDHKNGDRSDNRIENLRLASRSENGRNLSRKRNNTSGVPGVSWDRRRSRWVAYVNPNGRKVSLGSFIDRDSAIAARRAGEAAHFGPFARAQ